jgi:hypothetical protein
MSFLIGSICTRILAGNIDSSQTNPIANNPLRGVSANADKLSRRNGKAAIKIGNCDR